MMFKEPKQPVKILLRPAGEEAGGSAAPEKLAFKLSAGQRTELATELVERIAARIGSSIPFKKEKLAESMCDNASDSTLLSLATDWKQRFIEEAANAVRLVSAGSRPVHTTLAAVCASSRIPDAFKPMMLISTLKELNSELLEAKRKQMPQKVEERVGRLVRKAEDSFAKEEKGKKDDLGEFAFSALHSAKALERAAAAKPEAMSEREKELLCKEIAARAAHFMSEPTRKEFVKNFMGQRFIPALMKLPESVLHELADKDNRMAKLYARLHAKILDCGGFGGPATVIEAVAADKWIPDERKFAVIIVSLFDVFGAVQAEAIPKKKREYANDVATIGKVVSKWAGSQEKVESAYLALQQSMDIRSNVHDRMEHMNRDVSNSKAFFTDLSLRYFIPALLRLMPEARKALADNTPGSIGAKYTTWHATLLLKGGYQLPAMFVQKAADEVPDPEMEAFAVAAAVKAAVELRPKEEREGTAFKAHEGKNDWLVNEGWEVGKVRIESIARGLMARGKQQVKKELLAEFGFQ